MKIRQATKQGYADWVEGSVADCSYPTSNARRARVQEDIRLCHALQAGDRGLLYFESIGGGIEGDIKDMAKKYRIRKLTPNECWRLMGFSDEAFKRAEKVNSNTSLYKQAGNSIVVNVLMAILGQLIPGKEDMYKTYKEDFFKNKVESNCNISNK